MEYNQIQELLKAVDEASITKVRIKDGDFEITIEKQTATAMPVAYPMPQMQAAPMSQPMAASNAPAAQPAAAPAASGNGQTVKSPMIGTFYRSSAPDKPAFINVGDEIRAGQVVCIIEAMKLFNEIESEVSGRVVKVLVDDASPVEYDQPLFLVEPI
ncbi:MAG: acetyl-CoA carboxylase biotin carboxyl carrier protein [Sphingobacteriales bacterium]|nr:MAG: acetyl-CoA carboxylase biotin carboxyl carrier protein [Sphingobacteriales bacterium]